MPTMAFLGQLLGQSRLLTLMLTTSAKPFVQIDGAVRCDTCPQVLLQMVVITIVTEMERNDT